jgi:hypothetical protein
MNGDDIEDQAKLSVPIAKNLLGPSNICIERQRFEWIRRLLGLVADVPEP